MPVRFGTPVSRWVITAAVLGSGVAFLDSTVVNVALPAIARDLDVDVAGLQWILDAYLVMLTALLLFGGSLGDIAGRRKVFVAGAVAFAVASVGCGIAPTATALIAARALQGAAAAFLVPGSLAIISATFHPEDRARAIGAWSGLAGITSAAGPFVGGWLVDNASWRYIFLINVPVVAATVWIALRHVPETKDADAARPDWAGAAAVSVGLAGVTYALIEGPARGGPLPWVLGVTGIVALASFVEIERRSAAPMLPLGVFRSVQFTGTNLSTLVVYAALGGGFFLLVLQLQFTLRYSALAAGTSLLPFTIVMLLFSSRAGALAQRIGPRIPMTAGPILAGAGIFLLAGVSPGAEYVTGVLPGVLLFGAGMTLTVPPLTSTVLAAVHDRHVGVASGVNNAVARLGGLIAVAVLPSVAGIDAADPGTLEAGFGTAMRVSAFVCAAGGAIAFATVRRAVRTVPVTQSSHSHPCADPCLAEDAA